MRFRGAPKKTGFGGGLRYAATVVFFFFPGAILYRRDAFSFVVAVVMHAG